MAEFGTEVCFNTGNTEYISSAKLDSTHVVVVYRGTSDYPYARVGEISENTISWGTEKLCDTATGDHVSVCILDSTHFVIAYQYSTTYGRARVCSVSGTTITAYTDNTFNTGNTTYVNVATLDSTHFAVAYCDAGGSSYGCARIGSISGTTISGFGIENIFNSAVTNHIAVSALDSTHFVVAYQDDGGSDYGCARIGLVSGTTISSYGTENSFNSVATRFIAAATLDSTHFVIAFQDYGGGDDGVGIVGSVSTTTITFGSESVFNVDCNYEYQNISVDVFDSTHFVVVYTDNNSPYYGSVRQGTVSDTTITGYDTEVTFNSALTLYQSVTTLSDTDYVVCYKDDGGADYGCGRVWASTGWSGTIIGISSPAKVMGIDGANITSVIGIS